MEDSGLSVVAFWINAIVGILTLGALVVAVLEAVSARKVANRAETALITERRISFELALLSKIYEQFQLSGTAHLRGHVMALVREENSEDLLFLRKRIGARSMLLATDPISGMAPGSTAERAQIEMELDQAINRRMEKDYDVDRSRS